MRTLALAVLAALALSSCQSDDESRLSEREFFERTNAVCLAAAAASDWPATFSPFDFSPREWRIQLQHLDTRLDELRSLRPPADLDREWNEFLGAAERLLRANYDRFAVSPRPEIGSKEWRQAETQADVAERQMVSAATVLPLGISCRSGL